MKETAFLKGNNKCSIKKIGSMTSLIKNFIPPLLIIILYVAVPILFNRLELATQGESKIISMLWYILLILCIPFLLFYGYILFRNFLLVLKLKIDILNGVGNYIAFSGIVKNKKGRRTFGPRIDEYIIQFEGGGSFYVDKGMYSEVRCGDKVFINHLKYSRLVVRYKIA